jgi:hypothetical protein
VPPKIEFIGVTEDHEVPNPRNACDPGVLVVIIRHGRLDAVMTASTGKVEDLTFAVPFGFGYTKGRLGLTRQYYYNGRSLRALPKSDFTLVVSEPGGATLMPDLTVEQRSTQSKLSKVGKGLVLVGVAAAVVTVAVSSETCKRLAAKATDSLKQVRNR